MEPHHIRIYFGLLIARFHLIFNCSHHNFPVRIICSEEMCKKKLPSCYNRDFYPCRVEPMSNLDVYVCLDHLERFTLSDYLPDYNVIALSVAWQSDRMVVGCLKSSAVAVISAKKTDENLSSDKNISVPLPSVCTPARLCPFFSKAAVYHVSCDSLVLAKAASVHSSLEGTLSVNFCAHKIFYFIECMKMTFNRCSL